MTNSGRIVNTAIREAFRRGQAEAHPSDVIEKMQAFYAVRGATLQVQDFSKYIDFNGDGVIDENDKEGDDLIVSPTDEVIEESLWERGEVDGIMKGLYGPATRFASDQLCIEAVRLGRINDVLKRVDLSTPSDYYLIRRYVEGGLTK